MLLLNRAILHIIYSLITTYLLFGQLIEFKYKVIVCINILIITILLTQLSNALNKFYIIILTITTCLMYGTIETYGIPDFPFFLSLYYTNYKESASYITSVNNITLLAIIAYLGFTILFLKYSNFNLFKKKYAIISLLTFIIINIGLSYRLIKINNASVSKLDNQSYIFYTPLLKFLAFLHYNYNNINEYLTIQNNFIKQYDNNSYFNYIDNQLDKQIYLVVIGESVSSNYMHVFNKEIQNNTPFLNNSNAILFNNYIAPASSTVKSLMEIFTFKDQEYSIIHLLKGLNNSKLAWISSQEIVGIHDSPISVLANKCDTTCFIHPNKLNVNSDNEAIEQFKNLSSNKKFNIYFLHLYGSHPNPCDRIENPENFNHIPKDCYLESIKVLDKQLANLYEHMAENFKNFKMMYFSDHGIIYHKEKIIHGMKKSAFNSPLIIWDNAVNESKIIDVPRSGFDFSMLWEEFFDINCTEIENSIPFISNIPSTKSIKIYNNVDNSKIEFNNLQE